LESMAPPLFSHPRGWGQVAHEGIGALDVPLVDPGKVQVGQGLPQTLGKHLHRPLKPVPVALNKPPVRDSKQVTLPAPAGSITIWQTPQLEA
jgi:hypothetical protein